MFSIAPILRNAKCFGDFASLMKCSREITGWKAPSLHQRNAASVVQHVRRDQQQRGPGAQSDRCFAGARR